MALRKRQKRPYVGQVTVAIGSPEERFIGSPEEFFIGSPEERLPLLSLGSTGRWVVYVQQKLGVPVTGVYDLGTQAAVQSLQAQAGLAMTGVTDRPTWAALAGLHTPHQTFGANLLVAPYASYDPYSGTYSGYGPSYYGYPYYPFWFNNPPRGTGTSAPSGGGHRG